MKDDLTDLLYTHSDMINFSVWCGINYVSYFSSRDEKRIWFDPDSLKYYTTESLLQIWFKENK